jgi:hypothetical protein
MAHADSSSIPAEFRNARGTESCRGICVGKNTIDMMVYHEGPRGAPQPRTRIRRQLKGLPPDLNETIGDVARLTFSRD